MLAVGLVALIYAGSAVINQFGRGNNADNPLTQEEVDAFKSNSVERSSDQTPAQQPSYRRQSSIKESDVTGSWDGRVDEARILLQLTDGNYKIIIVPDNSNLTRSYSYGTYSLEQDLLMLYPDTSLKGPESKHFNYKILTRSKFPIAVSLYKERLIWQVPGKEFDIYVPNYHPVLDLTDKRIVAWKVLK